MSEPRCGGPATTFTIGDIVQLKSGGPKMTISRIVGDREEGITVECQWFVDGDLRQAFFHVYAIIPA